VGTKENQRASSKYVYGKWHLSSKKVALALIMWFNKENNCGESAPIVLKKSMFSTTKTTYMLPDLYLLLVDQAGEPRAHKTVGFLYSGRKKNPPNIYNSSTWCKFTPKYSMHLDHVWLEKKPWTFHNLFLLSRVFLTLRKCEQEFVAVHRSMDIEDIFTYRSRCAQCQTNR
jgi:hypothetical protein